MSHIYRTMGFIDGIYNDEPELWDDLDYRKGWFSGRAARMRGLISEDI